MPASNVQWPPAISNIPPMFLAQMGVPNSNVNKGLRQHVSGVVYYVDPNYPGASPNASGTAENPKSTVASALAAARRGDTIAVMENNSWQYGNPLNGYNRPISEEVLVTTPGVRIIGISQSSSTGVVWMPASNGGTCITVAAIDVLIEGFLFTQGTFTGCNAISAIWNSPAAFGDNLTVRNCVFDDTIDIAISLNFSWYVSIHHNTFWACDDTGIQCVAPGFGDEKFLEIYENVFHNCATHAMNLVNCEDSHIWKNDILNAVSQAGGAATDMGITTAGGDRNQVSDNTFSCLLPVPAAGDYNDLNTAAATDAWINNHCMNGMAVANPT